MAHDTPQRKHFEDHQPGADAAQTARRMAGAGFGTASQTMQDVSNRFANVFSLATPEAQRTVRRTSQNLSAVMEAGTRLSEASQAIWREWLDYAQQAARQQADGLQRIAAARSPHDLVDAQITLMREEMRTFLDSALRISAISSKAVRAAADQVREEDGDHDRPDHPQRRRA